MVWLVSMHSASNHSASTYRWSSVYVSHTARSSPLDSLRKSFEICIPLPTTTNCILNAKTRNNVNFRFTLDVSYNVSHVRSRESTQCPMNKFFSQKDYSPHNPKILKHYNTKPLKPYNQSQKPKTLHCELKR